MNGDSTPPWRDLPHAGDGAEVPRDRKMDGVDLVPQVFGEAEGVPHETLFWTQDHYRTVRHRDSKLQRSGPNDEFVYYPN